MAAARVSRRGRPPHGPVAPLVKPWSRGVQHQDGGVFHDGELNLEERSVSRRVFRP